MTDEDMPYYVYIITNQRRTVLYTGNTGELRGRVLQHKRRKHKRSFSAKYNVDRLVYYDECESPDQIIYREKQIKAGSRKKKIDLVERMNPQWNDLSKDWYNKRDFKD